LHTAVTVSLLYYHPKIDYLPTQRSSDLISPEQVLGHPIDRRADIWAVGAMLYRFLAGKPVYDAPCTMDSLQMLASRRPPGALPRSEERRVGKSVGLGRRPYVRDK